ncbi:MAG: hypothetical protein IKZ71_07745 [Bacteroidales bacterium]|nr:hypothetical protein [Bacteroidales bacterium]
MKKTIKYIPFIAASIFAFAACTAETIDKPVYKAGEQIKISATLPTLEDAPASVKVDFAQGTNKVDLSWSTSDQLTIIDEASSAYSTFDLTGVSGSKAEFSGTAVSGSSFTVLYPGTYTSVSDIESHAYDSQTQTGNGSLAHLTEAYSAKIGGLTDISNVAFAAPAGGSFVQSGILKFYLQMPDYVDGVKQVGISTDTDAFHTDNSDTMDSSLWLNLSGITLDAQHAFTAYMATSWNTSTVASGKTLTVSVVDGSDIEWKRDIVLSNDFVLAPGQVSVIKLNKNGWASTSRYAGGTGIEGDPYLIATPEQMVYMNQDLENGQTKYFKLIADIDMDLVNGWAPANNTAVGGKFDKGINFDGDNHTISNFHCSGVAYPSIFGVLHGTVKNLVVDYATITAGGNTAGVIAGYIGSSSGAATGSISGITVKNSSVTGGTKNRIGGIAGYAEVVFGNISDCHVINTTLSSTAQRVGGLIGEMSSLVTLSGCTAEDVSVTGYISNGGLVGVCYGTITDCSASGHVTTCTAYNKEVSTGGLVGHLEGNISNSSSSTRVEVTLQGRSIGGLVGTFKSGRIERCFSTGEVSSIYRNTSGFVGLIQAAKASATIENCYSTGNVTANSYMGGFVGLIDGQPEDVNISNCYSSGKVIASSSGAGGFIGLQSSAVGTVTNCVAWGSEVTAGAIESNNWSSAAFCGAAHPRCTITDCYRNPSMALTAYWVPDADYNHPDVSPSHPLVTKNGTESTATSTADGQPGYPQFPYHGKVEAGKTLSELASTTLGWDATIWDFSAALPTLK